MKSHTQEFRKPCLRSSPIIHKSDLDEEILDLDPESDATIHDTSKGSYKVLSVFCIWEECK